MVPTSFLKYTGLNEYLSRAFLVLKKICPKNECWNDGDGLSNISGEKFKRACQRSQSKKDDSFGQESKVGLYRKARYGGVVDPSYPPHWIFICNCDEICKQMLLKTKAKANDLSSRMMEKRLSLSFTKHAVGRVMENQGTWIGATGLWVEMKTISSTPYVPNKDGYLTDVLHSLGSSFVVGKGLHLPPGGEMCTKVMPF
jgi:hypothetical protein